MVKVKKERAKERARKENKTLDGLFNEWLQQYTGSVDTNSAKEFDDFMGETDWCQVNYFFYSPFHPRAFSKKKSKSQAPSPVS